MFGLLPNTADVEDAPQSLFSRIEAIGSRSINISDKSLLISLKGGMSLGMSDAVVDSRIPIELPIVYHRMLVFVKDRSFNLGVDFRFITSDRVNILSDLDIFLVLDDDVYWEHKTLLNIIKVK